MYLIGHINAPVLFFFFAVANLFNFYPCLPSCETNFPTCLRIHPSRFEISFVSIINVLATSFVYISLLLILGLNRLVCYSLYLMI